MEELLHQGRILLNPLSYFAELEESSPRSDADEGLTFIQEADGALLRLQDGGEWVDVANVTDYLRFRESGWDRVNVLCLHAKLEKDYEQVFSLANLGFGDHFVLIVDAKEFFRRVEVEVDALGHSVETGLVTYVTEPTTAGKLIQIGPFRKFSRHAAEQEYRLAVFPGTGKPLWLELGDLSDIAMMGNGSADYKLVKTPLLDNAVPAAAR